MSTRAHIKKSSRQDSHMIRADETKLLVSGIPSPSLDQSVEGERAPLELGPGCIACNLTRLQLSNKSLVNIVE